MVRAPLAVSLVLLVACKEDTPEPAKDTLESAEKASPSSDESTETSPEERTEAPIEGFVVLPDGTSVFTEPRDDAPTLTVDTRPRRGGWGSVFAVESTQDGFVAIANVRADKADDHCAATASWIEPFRIRLYVRPDALAPVTKRSAIKKFDDGTSIMLSAGVPLRALEPPGEGEHRHEADAAGLPLSVLLDSSAVGRSYEPGSKFTPPEPKRSTVQQPELRYDGRRLEGLEALIRLRDGVAVFADEASGEKRLLTVGNRCAELRVLADASVLAAAPEPDAPTGRYRMRGPGGEELGNVGILGVLEGGERGELDGAFAALGGSAIGDPLGTSYRVPKGAKVYWPDGGEAGVVAVETSFISEPTVGDGRQCFDLPLRQEWTLCFAESDVEKREPSNMLGGGIHDPLGGGLGVGGLGVGGLGSSGSTGFGSIGAKGPPKTRAGKAVVKGSLDKDIIRRIVRAHINEVRHCYEKALVKEPKLAGKVTVDFIVDASGSVKSAKVKETTLGDPAVSSCITKAVRRWKFPKPMGGGIVLISYPFVFAPG